MTSTQGLNWAQNGLMPKVWEPRNSESSVVTEKIGGSASMVPPIYHTTPAQRPGQRATAQLPKSPRA
jgi:hypothetical protein